MKRIVVIGAGILGAFSAYFLACAGAEVWLVERSTVGGAASGANAGGLNPVAGSGIRGPMRALALDSLALHRRFWQELGTVAAASCGARMVPRLLPAFTESEWAELVRAHERVQVMEGMTSRLLTGPDLRRVEPMLAPDAVGGLWTDGNARVDPGPYTRAVARAAQMRGARLLNAEVAGLRVQDRTVEAVVCTGGEELGCCGVVVATGAWTSAPERWLGCELPIEPVKGEILLAEAPGDVPTAEVSWRERGVYFAGAGKLWLGGTEDRSGYDEDPSDSARERILRGVRHLLPGLRIGRVLDHRVGLRPVTPDGLPLAGLAPGLENAFLALGGGRKGMLYGAALGLAGAETLMTGETSLPTGACAPERWMNPA